MSHTVYQNFIGIDIGKFEVVVAVYGNKQTNCFANTQEGWVLLYKTLRASLKDALIVLETTGGYELGLLLFLQKHNLIIHRANTRQVKNFIRSFGTFAKNDRLDAMALARYGFERHAQLKPFESSALSFELYGLSQRRIDLKKMLVQEKNRFASPRADQTIKESCKEIMAIIEKQIETIDAKLQELIDRDTALREKQAILEIIPGIGPVVARGLICFMPELGVLNQKEVASLAGLAPHANESGIFKGQRKIKGGRTEVRSMIYLAAMAASKSNTRFKTFYTQLVARGKKKIVALTALMRKLIVVANAKLKEMLAQKLIAAT